MISIRLWPCQPLRQQSWELDGGVWLFFFRKLTFCQNTSILSVMPIILRIILTVKVHEEAYQKYPVYNAQVLDASQVCYCRDLGTKFSCSEKLWPHFLKIDMGNEQKHTPFSSITARLGKLSSYFVLSTFCVNDEKRGQTSMLKASESIFCAFKPLTNDKIINNVVCKHRRKQDI